MSFTLNRILSSAGEVYKSDQYHFATLKAHKHSIYYVCISKFTVLALALVARGLMTS